MKLAFALVLAFISQAHACELCAIYGSANALGQTGSGFLFVVSEQYIPYNVSQFDGQVVYPANPDYLYSRVAQNRQVSAARTR